jgi:hypothetical protein
MGLFPWVQLGRKGPATARRGGGFKRGALSIVWSERPFLVCLNTGRRDVVEGRSRSTADPSIQLGRTLGEILEGFVRARTLLTVLTRGGSGRLRRPDDLAQPSTNKT